jgi:hypothetical protein
MTDEHTSPSAIEQRLLSALQVAQGRRTRNRRRQDQRKGHWLSSFSRFGVERHHLAETDVTR